MTRLPVTIPTPHAAPERLYQITFRCAWRSEEDESLDVAARCLKVVASDARTAIQRALEHVDANNKDWGINNHVIGVRDPNRRFAGIIVDEATVVSSIDVLTGARA